MVLFHDPTKLDLWRIRQEHPIQERNGGKYVANETLQGRGSKLNVRNDEGEGGGRKIDDTVASFCPPPPDGAKIGKKAESISI